MQTSRLVQSQLPHSFFRGRPEESTTNSPSDFSQSPMQNSSQFIPPSSPSPPKANINTASPTPKSVLSPSPVRKHQTILTSYSRRHIHTSSRVPRIARQKRRSDEPLSAETMGESSHAKSSSNSQSSNSTGSESSTEESGETEIDPQEEMISYQQFTTIDAEKQIILQIFEQIFRDWKQSLYDGFDSLLNDCLTSKTEKERDTLNGYFQQSLTTFQHPPLSQNSFVYYETLQTGDYPSTLYSIIANLCIHAPCSEAQCERLFSRLRLIVGDRRHSIKHRRLKYLLRLI